MPVSLWGDAFTIPDKKETKKLLKKTVPQKEVSVEKRVKSKKLTDREKLPLIYAEVNRILGVYKNTTAVLKTEKEVSDYIDAAISNGIIAVDTETNHSLDPITCKLMGVCLYTPGQKQAYIPISHVDEEGNFLKDQVSIDFASFQLNRIKSIYNIFHNGKFDFEVIKCTTGVELPINWDTMIGSRILNELERAGLKEQYIQKIDPSIEKYSIEHLFNDIPYEIVDPDIFALYAATDSFMTYKLYEYQLEEFQKPENKRLYNLFLTVEMPLVPVVASMELEGICIDSEYAKRLTKKYHTMLDNLDAKIQIEVDKYHDDIIRFKNSPEASTIRKPPKTLGEQIEDPINLSSPQQLSILIYDVLKLKSVSTKSPYGTGEEVLLKLVEKYPEFILGKLILERRGILKLLSTYIDKLPECVSEKDGRLHAKFLQIGADTGRFSSTDPNLQNIPSKNYEIRMMFKAGEELEQIEFENQIRLYKSDEVETDLGWKCVSDIKLGTKIRYFNTDLQEYENFVVSSIVEDGEYYIIKGGDSNE